MSLEGLDCSQLNVVDEVLLDEIDTLFERSESVLKRLDELFGSEDESDEVIETEYEEEEEEEFVRRRRRGFDGPRTYESLMEEIKFLKFYVQKSKKCNDRIRDKISTLKIILDETLEKERGLKKELDLSHQLRLKQIYSESK